MSKKRKLFAGLASLTLFDIAAASAASPPIAGPDFTLAPMPATAGPTPDLPARDTILVARDFSRPQ